MCYLLRKYPFLLMNSQCPSLALRLQNSELRESWLQSVWYSVNGDLPVFIPKRIYCHTLLSFCLSHTVIFWITELPQWNQEDESMTRNNMCTASALFVPEKGLFFLWSLTRLKPKGRDNMGNGAPQTGMQLYHQLDPRSRAGYRLFEFCEPIWQMSEIPALLGLTVAVVRI